MTQFSITCFSDNYERSKKFTSNKDVFVIQDLVLNAFKQNFTLDNKENYIQIQVYFATTGYVAFRLFYHNELEILNDVISKIFDTFHDDF